MVDKINLSLQENMKINKKKQANVEKKLIDAVMDSYRKGSGCMVTKRRVGKIQSSRDSSREIDRGRHQVSFTRSSLALSCKWHRKMFSPEKQSFKSTVKYLVTSTCTVIVNRWFSSLSHISACKKINVNYFSQEFNEAKLKLETEPVVSTLTIVN